MSMTNDGGPALLAEVERLQAIVDLVADGREKGEHEFHGQLEDLLAAEAAAKGSA